MSEDRLAALEARLQEVEDRLAIYQLLASYGPAVDSLQRQPLAAMWAADGSYDAGGSAPMVGAEQVAALLEGSMHQAFVTQGCAHVISLPHIQLHGDTAVATGYSRVYTCQGDHWQVARASANRWELQRGADGWRVKHRLNRPLQGDAEPREVLGRAFHPSI